MITLEFDVATGVAKLAQTATIKVGADVPVKLTFSAAPGTVGDIQLALGSDTPAPTTLAFTDDFASENSTTYTALLDASDTRLATHLSGKGPTTVNVELVCVLDGVRRVAPNVQVTVQPRVISGPESSAGGPAYLTETQTTALLAPPEGVFKIDGQLLKLWNPTRGVYQTISLSGAAGAEQLVISP